MVYRNGFLPGSLGRGGDAGGRAAEAQEAAPGPFCQARLVPSPAVPPLAGLTEKIKAGLQRVLGAIWLFLGGILAETVLPPQAPVDIIYTLI